MFACERRAQKAVLDAFGLHLNDEDDNKYITAKRAFPVGSEVLRSAPYAKVLFVSQWSSSCSYCFQYGDKLLRCANVSVHHVCM